MKLSPHFSQSRMAAAKPVEQAVLLATPAVVPAAVGETADMAGLAARSTANAKDVGLPQAAAGGV